LANASIGTLIHYPIAPHLQEAFTHLGHTRGQFPMAERIHDEVVSLPISPSMTSEQVQFVASICNRFNP